MQSSKLWILTTLSGIGLLGCKSPQPVVWVDLDKVETALAAVDPVSQAVPPGRLGSASSTFGLPALVPSSRGRKDALAKREAALSTMRTQLGETFESLLRAYRREMLGKAQVTEQALRELLAERRRTISDSVVGEISTVVAARADERSKVIVRLALLAGWPDSGVISFVPIARTSAVKARWEEEAEQLRERLLRSDAELDNQIAAILKRESELATAEAAIVAQRIKGAYAEAETDSLRRAAQRVRATGRLEPPQLLSRLGAKLPGQPKRQVTVPPVVVSDYRTDPLVPARLDAPSIRAKLNIWLRNHGYKLAPSPQGVPDKTGEFIAWSRP